MVIHFFNFEIHHLILISNILYYHFEFYNLKLNFDSALHNFTKTMIENYYPTVIAVIAHYYLDYQNYNSVLELNSAVRCNHLLIHLCAC